MHRFRSRRSTTARIPLRRAVWSWSSCCSRPRPVWATVRPRFSRSTFSRSRRASTTTRATRTMTCSSWRAAFPRSVCSRISRSSMRRLTCSITSRVIRRPRSAIWAAARVLCPMCAIRPVRSPTVAATCRSRRSTCRALQSAATAIWTGSSRILTARSTS